jgi:hypothetical protein
MKTTFLILLATFISVQSRATPNGAINDTTLASKVFPVSKGAYYTITIAGANTRLIRTKGDQVKIDMISTGRSQSRDKHVTNHSMEATSTGNAMNVQVVSAPGQDSTTAQNMYLTVYIPETVGFRLQNKNKITFGEGFQGLMATTQA